MTDDARGDDVNEQVITDHMLKIEWNVERGWNHPMILPSGPVGLHPFAHVFHYAVECYEGMKAYVDNNGSVRLFRPEMNMQRFRVSAKRMSLPDFDGEQLLKCIETLVDIDKDWIPKQRGYSMYLRPVIFSTTPWLGLTQCAEAMILVLCCPVGPYFKSGFVPIKLSVDSKYIRAWPGGTGNVKSGGNYGPTVISQAAATANGASQSLFVYDKHEYVTEAGTMNIFFLIRNEQGVKQLITPSLKDGTILPGVTRQSVIELSQQWNECETVEKMIPFAEIKAAFERGDVLEIFGTGTAAVIQPINGIVYEGKEYKPGVPFDDSMLQVRLTNFLIGVQYGDIDHPWSHVVPPSTTWSKPM